MPRDRLRDDIPFSCTGVDYFCPLYYRTVDDESIYKCFVSLFTRASTRGLVLMLVPDASNKLFVDALRAFISRRGCPQVMISDNGCMFTGELTQLFAASHGITWKFNLSNAPWQGAFWERLISSVKRCIKKTVKKETLTFNEVQTVLYEIENILNNRPLCIYDEEDLEE